MSEDPSKPPQASRKSRGIIWDWCTTYGAIFAGVIITLMGLGAIIGICLGAADIPAVFNK